MYNVVSNETEALRIAVQIEQSGERHYRACARVTRNAALKAFLEGIAAVEADHAATFRRLIDRGLEGGDAGTYEGESSALLSAIANTLVFSGGVMAEMREGDMTAQSILRSAIDSEMNSINFYQEIIAMSANATVKEAMREIIAHERQHMADLTGYLKLVSSEEA